MPSLTVFMKPEVKSKAMKSLSPLLILRKDLWFFWMIDCLNCNRQHMFMRDLRACVCVLSSSRKSTSAGLVSGAAECIDYSMVFDYSSSIYFFHHPMFSITYLINIFAFCPSFTQYFYLFLCNFDLLFSLYLSFFFVFFFFLYK